MELDPSKLPPTPLSKAFLEAQEKAKQTESEGTQVETPTPGETPQPGTAQNPEALLPVDRKDWIVLKYTRPLPGSRSRTMALEICTTEAEINSPAFATKKFAAIEGEMSFIDTVDERVKQLKPLTGIESPPPNVDDEPKSTTGKVCDLCQSDLVFKEGYNQEKKKAWAAFMCPKAGPDVPKELRCPKTPQWITAKRK